MEPYIDGEPVKIRNVRQAVAHGSAMQPKTGNLTGWLYDVQYNINMAHLKQLSRLGFIDDKKEGGMRKNI